MRVLPALLRPNRRGCVEQAAVVPVRGQKIATTAVAIAGAIAVARRQHVRTVVGWKGDIESGMYGQPQRRWGQAAEK